MSYIEGRVVDAVSLAPLAGVSVTLAPVGAPPAGAPQAVPPEGDQAPPPVVWNRELSGFYGNRWQCWEQHVRGRVVGITWREFCSGVLEVNPVLADDGYVFRRHKTYLLPANSACNWPVSTATTDEAGQYRFDDLLLPAEVELRAEREGYNPYRRVLYLREGTQQHVLLAARASTVVSNDPRYPGLTAPLQRVVDQALSMLGDDHIVFDALPPELRKLCHGVYYLSDPNSIYYKDICCADLVTVCLHAGGLDYQWRADTVTGGAHVTPHAANYYRPWPGNPKLIELPLDAPYLPGDILIYGNGAYESTRARHVNLYVGRMSGVDRSGKAIHYGSNYEVVNASIDWLADGVERGTGIIPLTLHYCVHQRCGYDWVKHVRLAEVERARGGAGVI